MGDATSIGEDVTIIKNILTSGFTFDEGEDLLRFRFKMLNIMLLISMSAMLIFALLNDLGLNELGDIERAINSGTDDFLSKPVNKWELITRVRTMLKLKHVTDKLERTLAYLSEIEEQTEAAKSNSD